MNEFTGASWDKDYVDGVSLGKQVRCARCVCAACAVPCPAVPPSPVSGWSRQLVEPRPSQLLLQHPPTHTHPTHPHVLLLPLLLLPLPSHPRRS